MKMDFTIHTLSSLLRTLLESGYTFYPLESLPFERPGKSVVLRHDVDLKAANALQTAILENQLGIVGTYYFRIVPESNKPEIISKIMNLGHEIGYHYEDLSLKRGNIQEAYTSFIKNLSWFRSFYPVKTICMHGSPKSKYDSRDLWKHYDYREHGIICEPYLDIDYHKVFYLTDTGRKWDGWRVSIRDKIPEQAVWNEKGLSFQRTSQIISAAREGLLPDRILITLHPQRWTNAPMKWLRELVWQRVKNGVKWWVVLRQAQEPPSTS